LRRAIQARDLEAFLAICSDDVVLHSPITNQFEFQGHSAARGPLMALFATHEGIEYSADVGEGTTRALFATANVKGQPTEEAFLIELDDQQKVSEITVFVRPLPGTAAFAAALAPRIARRYGRVPSWLSRLLFTPVAASTRIVDQFVGRLATMARSDR
jgi:hypothetical protein